MCNTKPKNEYLRRLQGIYDNLLTYGIINNYNVPRCSSSRDTVVYSFQEHVMGSINCDESFNSLSQYFHIERNRTWAIDMKDHSFIFGSQTYDKSGFMLKHSYTWWPNPLPELASDELSEIETDDYFTLFNSTELNPLLRMRTPIRIDYDYEKRSISHPACHIHLQHDLARIPVNKPLCIIDFIKFIIRYSYPDVYNDKKTIIDQLTPTNIKYRDQEFADSSYIRFNWVT